MTNALVTTTGNSWVGCDAARKSCQETYECTAVIRKPFSGDQCSAVSVSTDYIQQNALGNVAKGSSREHREAQKLLWQRTNEIQESPLFPPLYCVYEYTNAEKRKNEYQDFVGKTDCLSITGDDQDGVAGVYMPWNEDRTDFVRLPYDAQPNFVISKLMKDW